MHYLYAHHTVFLSPAHSFLLSNKEKVKTNIMKLLVPLHKTTPPPVIRGLVQRTLNKHPYKSISTASYGILRSKAFKGRPLKMYANKKSAGAPHACHELCCGAGGEAAWGPVAPPGALWPCQSPEGFSILLLRSLTGF